MRAAHAVLAVLDEALHRRDRALEREHDVVHRDLLGRPRQQVAAVGTTRRRHQLGLLEQCRDALQVGERQALGLRDRLQRHRLAGAVHAKLDEQADAVFGFGREDHGHKAYH
jgi:hypothetical protein